MSHTTIQKHDFNLDQKRVMHKPFYSRRYASIPYALTSPGNQRYLISFRGAAETLKSLLDVFHMHYQHCLQSLEMEPEPDDNTPFNLVWVYCVNLYFLHEAFVPEIARPEKSIEVNERDIMGEDVEIQLRQKMRALISRSSRQMKERVGKIWQHHGDQTLQVKEAMLGVTRLCKRLGEELAEEILAKKLPTRRVYIPEQMQDVARGYITQQVQTFYHYRFTRICYRKQGIDRFINQYHSFLETTRAAVYDDSPAHRHLLLTRYCKFREGSRGVSQQILANLTDIVNFRKHMPMNSYFRQQVLPMANQILNELVRHRKEAHKPYPKLAPKAVIMDQLNLKIRLSYQPPLLEAVGLLENPLSFAQRLCHQLSPEPYDAFASPVEMTEDYEVICNPLFGTYGQEVRGDQEINPFERKYGESFAKEQQAHIRAMKERLAVGSKAEGWRYMQVFSYLVNGTDYVKHALGENVPLKQFERFTHSLRQQLDEDQGENCKYWEVLGSEAKEVLGQEETIPFNSDMGIGFFEELFKDDKQADSEFEKHSNRIPVQVMILRSKVIPDLNERVKKFSFEGVRVHSAVKYLIMVYLALLREMSRMLVLMEEIETSAEKTLLVAQKVASMDQTVGIFNAETSQGLEYIRSMSAKLEGYRDTDKQGQIRYIERNHERSYAERGRLLDELVRSKRVMGEGVSEYQRMDFEGKKQLEARLREYKKEDFMPAWQQCKWCLVDLMEREVFRHYKPNAPLLLKTSILILKIELSVALHVDKSNYMNMEYLVVPALPLDRLGEMNSLSSREIKEKYELLCEVLEIVQEEGCLYTKAS